MILQLLSHISLLRDFFLRPENYQEQIKRAAAGDHMTLLVHRFGELIRKLWNPRNFKTHVSPHEFLQVQHRLLRGASLITPCHSVMHWSFATY